MLEDDNEGTGLNMYIPDSDDPYAANGLRTTVDKEIGAIVKKYGDTGGVKRILERITLRLPPLPSMNMRSVVRGYTRSLGMDDDAAEEWKTQRSKAPIEREEEGDDEENVRKKYERKVKEEKRGERGREKRGGETDRNEEE